MPEGHLAHDYRIGCIRELRAPHGSLRVHRSERRDGCVLQPECLSERRIGVTDVERPGGDDPPLEDEPPQQWRGHPGAADDVHPPALGASDRAVAKHRSHRDRAGHRVGADNRTHAERLPQHLGGDDSGRHVGRRERPGRHDRDTVGVAGCEVEIVEDSEHREAAVGQLARQIEHLHPVVEVEVAHRLIEQQHPRLGGERLGEGETLQVAAGQRVDGLVGEMLGIGEVHRAAHGLTVSRAGPAEARQMRVSPHLNELGGREGEGRAHLLRHHADERCALQRSHRCERDAADLDACPTAAASRP